VDELFHSKNSCTSHVCRIREYCSCEAIKVDLAKPEDKRKKNQPRTSKNELSSTVSLLRILFEDLGCAIKLHAKFATELHSVDPINYLFNEQEGGDDCNYFLFGQGIINEADSAEGPFEAV
jgi:hypothetical protein